VSFTAPFRRCLLIALALCLSACTKPSTTLPPPPTVNCEQGATPLVSPPPRDWYAQGAEWAIGVLGILQQERRLRAGEHECLAKLRESGAIR
jgi:hypothetical protein